MNEESRQAALAIRHLCTVEFEVGGGLIGIGASPFGDQRLGYISGGRFFGPRIKGIVLPGGGNWSRSGRLGDNASVGTFDARAVWQTDDGDLIYLSYTSDHRVNGSEHMLGGTKGDLAYVMMMRRDGGMTDVDLVASGGR